MTADDIRSSRIQVQSVGLVIHSAEYAGAFFEAAKSFSAVFVDI